PKKPNHKQTCKAVENGTRVAGMSVGDDLHVGDASAKRPAERAEKREVHGSLVPIAAPGKQNSRKTGQSARDHRAVLVAKIAANAPTNRQRQGNYYYPTHMDGLRR